MRPAVPSTAAFPIRISAAILAFAAVAGSARSSPPAKAAGPATPARTSVQTASSVARWLATAIARIPRRLPGPAGAALSVLEWSDACGWDTPGPVQVGMGDPAIEAVRLVVTFRVPQVEFRQVWFNTLPLLGTEIPGTRIGHAIWIDCLVHGWIRTDRPVLRWDPERPGQLVARLPRFERFTAEFPEDANGRYKTEFGSFKPEFLFDDLAHDQRAALYESARSAARDRLVTELAQDPKLFAAAVARELESQFSDESVEGAADESGGFVRMPGYFGTGDPDGIFGSIVRTLWQIVLPVVVLAAIGHQVVARLRRRVQP